MRIAVRELLRKPGRFVFVGGALVVLVILMLFLGALLDGLYLNSTGAIRAVDADLLVLSDDSRQSLLRSSVDGDERAGVAGTDGITEVGGFGVALLGIQIPGESDIADGAIIGYELPSSSIPDPPGPGDGFADRSLQDAGADVGDVIEVGPAASPIQIVGWVEDSNYLQQSGVWVSPDTWRGVQNQNRPDAPVGAEEFQALVARTADGENAANLAVAVERNVAGVEPLTENQAINAIPGIEEQNATFTAVIGATVLVAALVVTLFFALLTVERTPLYAVLKALGGSSTRIMVGVATQAVLISSAAFVVGGVITAGLARVLPPEIPAEFQVSRAAVTLLALLATSILGSLVSLRRINRIDPASALGAGV